MQAQPGGGNSGAGPTVASAAGIGIGGRRASSAMDAKDGRVASRVTGGARVGEDRAGGGGRRRANGRGRGSSARHGVVGGAGRAGLGGVVPRPALAFA